MSKEVGIKERCERIKEAGKNVGLSFWGMLKSNFYWSIQILISLGELVWSIMPVVILVYGLFAICVYWVFEKLGVVFSWVWSNVVVKVAGLFKGAGNWGLEFFERTYKDLKEWSYQKRLEIDIKN